MKLIGDIDLDGNEIKNAKFEEVTSFPVSPFVGQMVLYKPTPQAVPFFYYWNGLVWVSGVTSWAGRQGDVTPVKADVGLGNVDNTSDANKPISTATQTALNAKQPLDTDLTQIAAIAASNDDIIQRKAGAWTNSTLAQIRNELNVSKYYVQTLPAITKNNTYLITHNLGTTRVMFQISLVNGALADISWTKESVNEIAIKPSVNIPANTYEILVVAFP